MRSTSDVSGQIHYPPWAIRWAARDLDIGKQLAGRRVYDDADVARICAWLEARKIKRIEAPEAATA